MLSEIDYQKKFTQARTAYLEENLEEAQDIINDIIKDYPDDPSVLLLKGHVHLRQQDYSSAKNSYKQVLELTDHQDLVSLAQQGLAEAEEEDEESFYPPEVENPFGEDVEEFNEVEATDQWTSSIQLDSIDWDIDELEEDDVEDPTLQQNSPFQNSVVNKERDRTPPLNLSKTKPSNFDDEEEEDEPTASNSYPPSERDYESDMELEDLPDDLISFNLEDGDIDYDELADTGDDDFDPDDLQDTSAPTFVVSSEEEQPELRDLEQMLTGDGNLFGDTDDDYGDYSSQLEPLTAGRKPVLPNTAVHFSEEELPLIPDAEEDLFFAPDELDDIPDLDAGELPVSSIFTRENKQDQNFENFNDVDNVFDEDLESDFDSEITGSFTFDTDRINLDLDEEDISVSSAVSDLSSIPSSVTLNPEVEIPQGKLAKYYDLSLLNKQFIHGGVIAIVTFFVVLIGSSIFGLSVAPSTPSATGQNTEQAQEGEKNKTTNSWGQRFLLSLVTGVAGGFSSVAMGYMMTSHIKRYTSDLQNQFESIYQGDYEVKATVYSQDEFGTLAAGFNQMTKMIYTTTTEARKRAEETERAREDLQRQVIRLLDDVEGAARGDLTVQAEVTADVLGAVADAFNLTINNLRKIVKQVQQAAVQVNKASTDSEVYARNQSSDALRMAEELAVTLNSVQMMTDSIQRVAENAREAEEVARSSSVTALKGGDAVERTVAGILQIRETVLDTTRKVKKLAEASQQISTIVAVISQIASRTNLLALNASIQAARAGEAGRGFAIVADEVRQLADRSAKSLQEIEQIVLKIQTETGAVMTAMEEGIQQVKDVADRSEQAKRSLEDIIQVANKIDALVRSITADTDEQRENSRGVAKVMQAVELTAQATSQESQRVAGSLQNLVGIAKDLIASVERFKVDGE